MKKKLAFLIVTVLLFCSGCQAADNNKNKIKIVASLFPQYDFCREIAGDKADITLLLPPGMESHNYEPSVSDALSITKSDVFIYTGEYMEPWAETIIDGIGENTTIVDCSSGIDLCEHIHSGEEEHEEHEHEEHEEMDPHIWTDPINCVQMVKNILSALCKADSKNADYYTANAENYIKQLYALDEEFTEISNNAKTKILCHGGRFSMTYFAKRYGFEFKAAFDSCSSSSEPSAQKVISLINTVKEENICGVFYEELTVPKVAKVIGEETNVPIYLLHTCHNLSKEEFENGETYISLMKQNAINLKKVLGV